MVKTNKSSTYNFLFNRDPRLKLIIALAFVGFTIFTPSSHPLRLIFLLLIILLIVIGDFRYLPGLLKRLAMICPMIFFISLFSLFKDGDNIAYSFMSVNIYDSGVNQFLMINFKLIMIYLMLTYLSISTKFSDILLAVKSLKLPELIISVLYFTNRFIFILIDEWNKKILAVRSRYITLTLLEKNKVMIRLIATSTLNIFKKNESVYAAMMSRGFYGVIPEYKTLKWNSSDTSLLLITAVLFAISGVYL